MKKISTKIMTWFSSIAIFFITGCSLDEEFKDTLTRNDIETVEDLNLLMEGAYAEFLIQAGFKSYGYWMVSLVGDDLFSTANTLAAYGEKSFSSADTNQFWGVLYRTIGRVNNVLDLVEELDIDEEEKEKFRGEASFMRAFCYFYLVRLYGEVPLRTEALKVDSDFYLGRSSVEKVYEQIFKDLEVANTYCRSVDELSSKEIGRATKGAAQAIMASAKLTFGNWLDLNGKTVTMADKTLSHTDYYKEAVAWSDSVIISDKYKLFNDYADLWDVYKEANVHSEVIFSIQFARDPLRTLAASKGSEFAWRNLPNNYWGGAGPISGSGDIEVSQAFFYEYYSDPTYAIPSDKNVSEYPEPDLLDYRMETSFASYFLNTNNGRTIFTCPFMQPDLPGSERASKPMMHIMKYIDPEGKDNRNQENDLNIIRYSEIFLIKAEALNELGDTPGAIEAFNTVRRRARRAGTNDDDNRELPVLLTNADVPDTGSFRSLILKERGLEFVGEGLRWFDLVRMKSPDGTETMFDYRFKEMTTNSAKYSLIPPTYDEGSYTWLNPNYLNYDCVRRICEYRLQPNRYRLFPIPSQEIENNPNITSNNPGW